MSDDDLRWLGWVIELVDDVLDLCPVCSFAVGRGEREEAGRDRREAGRGRQR